MSRFYAEEYGGWFELPDEGDDWQNPTRRWRGTGDDGLWMWADTPILTPWDLNVLSFVNGTPMPEVAFRGIL